LLHGKTTVYFLCVLCSSSKYQEKKNKSRNQSKLKHQYSLEHLSPLNKYTHTRLLLSLSLFMQSIIEDKKLFKKQHKWSSILCYLQYLLRIKRRAGREAIKSHFSTLYSTPHHHQSGMKNAHRLFLYRTKCNYTQ